MPSSVCPICHLCLQLRPESMGKHFVNIPAQKCYHFSKECEHSYNFSKNSQTQTRFVRILSKTLWIFITIGPGSPKLLASHCTGSKIQVSETLIIICHALPHCLGLLYWHFQLVLVWYLHQPELHQLSFNNVCEWLRDTRTHRSDPRYTWVR